MQSTVPVRCEDRAPDRSDVSHGVARAVARFCASALVARFCASALVARFCAAGAGPGLVTRRYLLLITLFLCWTLLGSAARAAAIADPCDDTDPACLEHRALALLSAGHDAQGVLAELSSLTPVPLDAPDEPHDQDAAALALALHQTRTALRPLLSQRHLDNRAAQQLDLLFDQLQSQQLLYDLRFAHIEHTLARFQAAHALRRLQQQRASFAFRWQVVQTQLTAVRQHALSTWLAPGASPSKVAAPLPYSQHLQLQALDQSLRALAPNTRSTVPEATYGLQPLPQQRPGLLTPPLPTTEGITPSYHQGATTPAPVPQASDLTPDPATALTEPIRAKAASLAHDPVQLFDFVRTQIRTEFYPGARKSAAQVLASGSGNDVDQASLLIALLRASRTPARYVHGVIEVPADHLAQLLGVPATRIGRALNASGTPHEPVLAGGAIRSWRIAHTWVSAWVPYGHYRGTPIDASAPIWLPLAPALKRYAHTPATDLLQRAGLTGRDWVANWLGSAPVPAGEDNDQALPLAALRSQLLAFLAAQPPPLAAYDTQLSRHVLDTPPLQVLPAGLPFPAPLVLSEAAELTPAQHQHLRIRLRRGPSATDPVALDLERPLSDFLDRRISLSYAPATIDDTILLNLRGGFASIPAWLIRLRPQVLIDGQPVQAAAGVADLAADLSPGQIQRLELTLQSPAGDLTLTQQLTAGTLHTLRLAELHDHLTTDPASTALPDYSEPEAAVHLAQLARRYTRAHARDTEELAALTGVRRIAPWPSIDLVISQAEPIELQGLIEHLQFKGVALDAALHSTEAIGTQPTDSAAAAAESDYYHLAGLQGSTLEATTFRDQWAVPATSADRLLRQARRQQVPLHIFIPGQDPTTAGLTHPATVLAQVQDWLHRGYHVQLPRTPLTADTWTGSAWRVWRDDTGEAGYFLSGTYAGAISIPPPHLWSLQALADALSDPFAQPPNPDPTAGALLAIDETIDRQTGRASETLPTPLTVYLFDATGRAVQGASVRFSASQGTARLIDGAQHGESALKNTDRRGKAEVAVRLGERLGEFGQYIVPEPDAQPEFHGVTAIRPTVSLPGRTLATAKDFEVRVKAGPPARWNTDWDDKTEVDTQGLWPAPTYRLLAGLQYQLIRVAVEDAFGNRVANASVQFRSTLESYYTSCTYAGDGPRFFTAGQCPAKLRYESACGVSSGQLKTSSRMTDLFVQPTDREQATGVITLSSAGLPDQQYRWADPGSPAACGHRLHGGFFARWVVRPSGQETVAVVESGPSNHITNPPYRWLEVGTRTAEAAPPGQWLGRPQRYTYLHNVNGQYQPAHSLQRLFGTQRDCSAGLASRNAPCIQNIHGEAGIPYMTGSDIWLPIRMPDVPRRVFSLVNIRAIHDPQTNSGTTLLLHPDGYAVEALQQVQPRQIAATGDGVILSDVEVATTILPEEYAALTGSLSLEGDDGVVRETTVAQPGNALGFVLPRGFSLEGNGNLQATSVLNAGTPWEIRSETTPLDIHFGMVTAYGMAQQDNASAPIPLINGVYSQDLTLRTTVDVPQRKICRNDRTFAFRLARPARIHIEYDRIVIGARPGREAIAAGHPEILINDQPYPAGTHELALRGDHIQPGAYAFHLRATDPDDPTKTERYQSSLTHDYHELDGRSFGHSTVHDVNVFDGTLGITRTDLTVPGRGPALHWSRHYASVHGESTPFGYLGWGWNSALQQRVVKGDCNEVTVHGGDSGAQSFVYQNSTVAFDHYTGLKGTHGALRFDRARSAWQFHHVDGTLFEFAESRFAPRFPGFRLTAIIDPSGQRLDLTYERVENDLLLKRIHSPDQRFLEMDYTRHELRFLRLGATTRQPFQILTSVRSSTGDRVDYRYDDFGNLIAAEVLRNSQPGLTETYQSTDLGNEFYTVNNVPRLARHGWKITRIHDQMRDRTRTFSYIKSHARVVDGAETYLIPQSRVDQVTEPDNGLWRFDYIGERGGPTPSTLVIDPRTQRSEYAMNPYGAVTTQTDPAGTQTTEWDMLHMKPASQTDRQGLRTEWTRDSYGNALTERISGIGPVLQRSWTYKAPEYFDPPFIKNRKASETNARGVVTTYGYDTHGRRTTQSRGGITETWTYADNGDLQSARNGAGDTTTYTYTEHGLLSAEFAPLGATRSHTWDTQGRRISSTDERGELTRWQYDGLDRITRIEDSVGIRTIVHGFDTRNETDERGHLTQYQIDPMDRIVQILRSDGEQIIQESNTYDQVGNLLQHSDPRGQITTHTYNDASHRIRTTAPGGLVIDYTYDAEGHLLTETRSGAGGIRTLRNEYEHPLYQPTRISRGGIATETLNYDASGNLIRRIDPRGFTTIQEYDDRDRLIQRIEPESRSSTFAWDGADRQTLERLSSGWTRTTVYNALGQPIQITDGEGKSLARTYDKKGNALTQTDRRGATIAWTYDARSRKTTETGPVPGLQTTWTYDPTNNITTETRANGQVLAHQYDDINRRIQTRDADGVLETLIYDKSGNVLTQTDANGRITRFDYNALNQRTRQIASLDRISQIVPSVHGEVLSETMPTGGITTHQYDALSRRTRTEFPQTPSDNAAPFVTWVYDPSGNVIAAKDARGFETISEYDGLNRQEKQTDPAPLSYVQQWTYDTASNVLTHIDRNSITTAYTYDTENRKKTTARAGSTRERLEYDGEGGLTARIDALNRRSEFVLDALGRVTETRLPENIVRTQSWSPLGDLLTANDGTNRITRFTYDLRRRKITEANAANETTRFAYDAVGNVRLQAAPLFTGELPNLGNNCANPTAPSHAVRFCYDEANRLVAVIDPERNKTSYEYDLNDNLTAVIEPLGNRSEFKFDQRNRRIEKRSPDLATGPPQVWSWTYDANGNPATQTDPVGTVSTHTYDALNRRAATTFANAPAGSPSARAWAYDPNGNPTRIGETRDGQTVALEFTYDTFNRPTNLLDANARAWTTTYDAADQRRSLTSEGVPTVQWNYDNAARNTQTIIEGAGTFTLGYDAADRNESIHHPNGVHTTHSFDAAGRISNIHHAANGGTLARFQYRYDANGNRASQSEENGTLAQTSTYAYDFADRLTEITEPSKYTRYTLDPNSNRIRTDEGSTAAATTKRYESTFDARNEISQQREYNSGGIVVASTNFEFDANGNIARQVKADAQTEYRYDALDRLISVTPPTGPPANYGYGPSDLRIAWTSGGMESRLHYDGERLILESNVIGNPQKHYAYTAAGLLNSALLGSSPVHRSAHLDAQTSPIALSAANSNIVSRTHFDPFGVETPIFGVRDHRVSHQGYWSEPELQSAGAQLSAGRLYLPNLGIFPERDPAKGNANSPISFNPYLIGRSNPLRWLDPDGRCDLGCQYAHQRAYNGSGAANHHLEINFPKTAVTLGSAAAIGDTTRTIVQSPFQLATAIGGTALEYSGLRSGNEYSDHLGGMIAGGVNTASGIYNHGPVDYATIKAGEVARRVQDAVAEGRYFDASREGGNALIGTALGATGVFVGAKMLATRLTPEVPSFVTSEDRRFASVIDGELQQDAKARDRDADVQVIEESVGENSSADSEKIAASVRQNIVDSQTARFSSKFELFAAAEFAINAVMPYSVMRELGLKDAHHIIQHAAVRDIGGGYSHGGAPAVRLEGPSTAIDSEHYNATQYQGIPGGGTLGAERAIAQGSLFAAGLSELRSQAIVRKAMEYFRSIGADESTPTRIPGNRR